MRLLLTLGVIAAMGAAGTVMAHAAGWVLPDNHASLIAGVAPMPRGAKPRVAPQNGQAVVSWTAQQIAPGSLMDHYIVTAHHVGDADRPNITRLIAASGATTESATFASTELAGGTWYWTTAPRFREWTGPASEKSRDLPFAERPVERSAAPSKPPATAPPGSPSPGVSSSAPVVRESPTVEGTITVPDKQPETTTPDPVRSADPPPLPVESTGSGVEAPPAAQ